MKVLALGAWVVLWGAHSGPPADAVGALVEISSTDEGEGLPPKEVQQLEDAVALAFNGQDLHVETRRQRLSRTPPQVYGHQQALQACANPNWPKSRVLRCIQAVAFPSPPLRPPRLVRATHLLRISRGVNASGELLALSLTPLGKNAGDEVVTRQLDQDATLMDRRQAALDLASQLLAPLRKGAH